MKPYLRIILMLCGAFLIYFLWPVGSLPEYLIVYYFGLIVMLSIYIIVYFLKALFTKIKKDKKYSQG